MRIPREVTEMMGFILAAAAGAAAMYFFDPQVGRGRRTRLRDMSAARVRDVAEDAQGVGQDVRNRAYGTAHEATDVFRSESTASHR